MKHRHANLIALLLAVGWFAGCGEQSPPAASALPAAPAASEPAEPEYPPPPDPSLQAGYDVFAQVCHKCHIDSDYAPEIDDPANWARRLARAENGKQTLYEHAIEGFGEMPARGGGIGKDLSDDQIKAGVDYMLAINAKPE